MKLLIGGGTYTVRWMTDSEAAAGNCSGLCRSEVAEILIERRAAPSIQAMILWHEITHAIYYTSGLGEELNEEQVCRGLEGPWMQVMRDNPQLMDALIKASRNGKELPL
jgi:hypothetical protein